MYQGKLQIVKSQLVDPPLSEEEEHGKTCSICFDIATFPIRCTVCKTIYCLKCAAMWKSQHDTCPKKCQSPWTYEMLESLKLKLKCPYGLDKCPTSEPQTLIEHLQKCTFKPEEVRKALYRKKLYRCQNDHPLEFWVGLFEQMIGAKCAECQQRAACRSRCQICQLIYCVNCRPPPCSKTECPNKHSYIFTKAGSGYVCDICGLHPSLSGLKVYDDVRCNFGFCEWCYKRLPEEPTTAARPNNYSDCQSGHQLIYMPPTDNICSFCQNKKILSRECKQCERRYCTGCKPIRIRKTNKCQKGHPLAHMNHEEGHDKICTNCNTQEATIQDEQCNFTLCMTCLQNLTSHQYNMERLTGLFCSEDHRLRMYDKQQKRECHQCHSERYCNVYCSVCGPLCMVCKPPNINPCCYVGHQVKKVVKEDNCRKCCKINDRFMECDECDSLVCEECYK